MKKLIFALSLFCLCQGSFARGKFTLITDTIPCNETVLDDIDAALDSIQAFFDKVQYNFSSEISTQFMDSLKLDSVQGGFALLKELQTEYEDKYIIVHNNFVTSMNLLRSSVYSADLTEAQKYQLVLEKLRCYVDHIPSSDSRLAGDLGGDLGDPCWDTYTSCKRTARSNRIAGWWGCTFGGLGVAAVSGGLGLGLGIACHAANTANYNTAVNGCESTYNGCSD